MRNKMMRIVFIILLAATCWSAAAAVGFGQSATGKQVSPDALVKDLYRAHDQKRGPFFQTKSRALLDKYFEKTLANMIWKDRVTSKGEVGVLDGDPLYDAQDMEIKNFAIGKAEYEGAKARVPVTLENLGQKNSLVFMLGKGSSGWRIHDIDYGQEGTLHGCLTKGT